ncbi:MAG: amidohydrolase [Saprospiraceae bacterium]|nr:MAG: amidohydrolase [Saprospiraceae bacterium]
MPAFPIVDTHLHLWDPQYLRYVWLDDIPLLNKAYLLEEYKKATAHVEVEKMVFLQCECSFDQCEEEAGWVTELAKVDKRIQGIVPWAPIELGEKAKDILDRYSENKLIKGIRRIIQFEPDIKFCLQPNFVRGVQMLADYDLSFDICISHIQLKNTIELVRQCPDVRFILDHIGKPDIKNQNFEPWKNELRELAKMQNVHCKMSGLVTEADHHYWTKEDLKPYIDHVMDCFGVDRVIFGGDWPVAFQATTYPRWVETLDWALAGYSENDLRKIYRENAIAFYKL